jgi:uncharacterized protein (TIGR02996 family)
MAGQRRTACAELAAACELLEQSLEVLEDDLEWALQLVIAAWREVPLAELAELAERLSVCFAPAPDVGFCEKTDAATVDKWIAIEEPTESDIAELLHFFPIGTGKNIKEIKRQAHAMLRWPRDPRVAAKVIALFRSHWQYKKLLATLDEVLLRHPDPRQSVPKAAVRASAQTRATPPEASPRLQALIKQLDAAVPRGHEHVADDNALLATVYANPGSDDARAVYADLLSERGDPRGEFIGLQLLETPSASQRARATQLARAHRQQWSSALGAGLFKNVRFARGFPAHAELDAHPRNLRRAILPSWSTLTFLTLPRETRLYEDWCTLLCDPVFANVNRLGRVTVELLRLLRASNPSFVLREISIERGTAPFSQRVFEEILDDRELREVVFPWPSKETNTFPWPSSTDPWDELLAACGRVHTPDHVRTTSRGVQRSLIRSSNGTPAALSIRHDGRTSEVWDRLASVDYQAAATVVEIDLYLPRLTKTAIARLEQSIQHFEILERFDVHQSGGRVASIPTPRAAR